MAKNVIKELELGKMHKRQLDLSQELIQVKDKMIENQKGIINTQIEQKNNLQLVVEEQNKAIVLQTTILDNKEKIIKKEKRRTNIWKIVSLATTSLLGAVLIIK